MTTATRPAGTWPAPGYDHGRPGPGDPARRDPVIVLTYAYSGAERLQSLLARHPELACTSGTGILPLCEQAAATWRNVDGRPEGPLSALAITSTRALATGIITALLAQAGNRRWCELATASPVSAETFSQLYPGTRFLCLHRACPDVAHAALHTSPWGLAGPTFAPFNAAHPASSVAALTAYWTAHTGPLLAFEQAHPGNCRRVRYEDLATDAEASQIFAFLGLPDPSPGIFDRADANDRAPHAGHPTVPIPAAQIPAPLLAQANQLNSKLSYPPLGPG